jgi:hypothetical protein
MKRSTYWGFVMTGIATSIAPRASATKRNRAVDCLGLAKGQ